MKIKRVSFAESLRNTEKRVIINTKKWTRFYLTLMVLTSNTKQQKNKKNKSHSLLLNTRLMIKSITSTIDLTKISLPLNILMKNRRI